VTRHRRSLWFYPLFQIPLMFLAACLVAAALFWVLGLGRPNVAVAIALDLSNSTYAPQAFNAPGTVMEREVQAVRSYLQRNNQLQVRNQVQIFGFGGAVRPLTSSFNTDGKQIETELTQALQSRDLPQQIVTNTTDLNLAIQKGTEALSSIPNHCRDLLLVTDGAGDVSPSVVVNAVAQKVRLNSIIVGAEAPELKLAAFTTNGIYIAGAKDRLENFFTKEFFAKVNTNIKWIVLWLGAAWIALMWMLTLPLDRWIFQGLMRLEMPLAGQLSLGNALFWSVLTPILIWQILKLLDLPFFSAC